MNCAHVPGKVVETRTRDDGVVRRAHLCLQCGARVSTWNLSSERPPALTPQRRTARTDHPLAGSIRESLAAGITIHKTARDLGVTPWVVQLVKYGGRPAATKNVTR